MEIALALLAKIWKPLAIVAAVAILWFGLLAVKHSYDDARRAEGAAPALKQLTALQDQVKAAQDRASALALQWDTERQKAEAAAKGMDDERSKRLAEAQIRVKALPAVVAAVVVPAAALGVLDDAIRASEPVPAPGPAREPEQARPVAATAAPDADGTLGPLIQWGAQVVTLYDACRDQVHGWQAFYRGLQAAQPKESPL